jgi:hypothetical protein
MFAERVGSVGCGGRGSLLRVVRQALLAGLSVENLLYFAFIIREPF